MRIMGLDYGDRRIGVAVSDAFGWTAQGVGVVEATGGTAENSKKSHELVPEHEVAEIVVGLPKNMNGSIGPRGEICIAFAEHIRQKLNYPFTFGMKG